MFSNGKVSCYIDGTFEPHNWMKAINCARYRREQNLVILQDNDELFYESARDVTPGEELLVWYGNAYERYMDIPVGCKMTVKVETSASVSEESTGKWTVWKSLSCKLIKTYDVSRMIRKA